MAQKGYGKWDQSSHACDHFPELGFVLYYHCPQGKTSQLA